MAAPLKDSLDYVSIDCDFFFDQKIKGLKVEHKSDGVLAYIYLLAAAGRTKGYYAEFNKFTILDIADYFHISKETAKEILDFTIEDSLLFDKTLFDKYAILTSKSFQKRFQKAKRTVGAKRTVKVNSKYWLLSKDETESYIELCDDFNISKTDEMIEDKSDNIESKSADLSANKSKPREKKNYADVVTLTDNEYAKLMSVHSKPFVDKCIEVLNNYKMSNGKKYKSDYHAILSWVIEKVAKEHPNLDREVSAQNSEDLFDNPWDDMNG